MKIVLFGYGEMGCTGLEFLLSQKEDVAAVITHHADPKEKRWFRSLSETAKARGVAVHHDPAIVKELRPTHILSFYYRDMISMSLLQGTCAMNLHGSLLPRLRGRAPLNWALVECEKQTGVTLHHMVAKPDAGDIVAQRPFDIAATDTARMLFDKAVAETKILLADVWPKIRAGTAPRVPQDHSKATYRGRRTPEDGCIDWKLPARRIDGLVRAVTDPFPGAFTTLKGKKVMVWQGAPVEGKGAPGNVIDERIVAAGEGAYRIDIWNFEGASGGPPLKKGTQLGA